MSEAYAKKSFVALINPYDTVAEVYPGILDEVKPHLASRGYAYYTGYKDTSVIPDTLMADLHRRGFLKHTKDRMALGGRAVDLRLVNPLTGRWMSGSSSGTALNVFYGINDLGVGTDGGGSVLAPAAALNLFGFISPLIEAGHVKTFEKKSTDGISFTPSIGFITRDLKTMETALRFGTGLLNGTDDVNRAADFVYVPEAVDIYGRREELIPYVRDVVRNGTVLVSEEGPVDLDGMGDSIFGHFGGATAKQQKLGKKGLMRVANMCGLAALTVPGRELGKCSVYLCDNNPADLAAVFARAAGTCVPASPLLERYFLNLNMYFNT